MHLPPAFTAQIERIFGDRGQAWLAQLPQILARCQERWNLTDPSPAGSLSYNLVCFAESPVYGSVVLKIGVPNPELLTEKKALSLFAGRPVCACHDADEALGALLLERIMPGADLTSIQSREERFSIAAGVIATLAAPVADGHGFPSYADWIGRAFTRVRQENRAGPDLLALVDMAEHLFHEMETDGRPRVLLHGDLHHKNILQGRDGLWKAIDPKGVTGPSFLEAGRFMINEFWMGAREDRFDRFDQMTAIFARRLGESKRLLAGCAFVERVLATCWSVEENMAPDELQAAVEECAALLGYYRQLDGLGRR